jgi:hypothetical protein
MHSCKRVRGRTLRKIEELFDSSWWVGKTALSLITEQSGFKEAATRAVTSEFAHLKPLSQRFFGLIMLLLRVDTLLVFFALDN